MQNENRHRARNGEIVALYYQGLSQREIAARFKMTKADISLIIRKFGFKNGKNQTPQGREKN